jgi:hypothetical protein
MDADFGAGAKSVFGRRAHFNVAEQIDETLTSVHRQSSRRCAR